jgi:hypothetical protein
MNCTRRLFALVLLVFSLAPFSLLSGTQTTEGPDPAPPSPWGLSTTLPMSMPPPPTLMRSLRAFSEPSEVRARSRSLPR